MTRNTNDSLNVPDILVMGIGNFLMGDEGVGVHFIINYEKNLSTREVEVLDGGTGGFHLMSHFEGHEKVILIDATMDGKPPGTVTLLKPKFSFIATTIFTMDDYDNNSHYDSGRSNYNSRRNYNNRSRSNYRNSSDKYNNNRYNSPLLKFAPKNSYNNQQYASYDTIKEAIAQDRIMKEET